jgi:hypothetical protein
VSNDAWGITIGLSLTVLSLVWTEWSWTAQSQLNLESVQTARSVTLNVVRWLSGCDTKSGVNLHTPFLDPSEQCIAGLVTDTSMGRANDDSVCSDIWKLNTVLVTICCFVAMILTEWGTIVFHVTDERDSYLANPTAGCVNMAMIGISQLMAIG